MKLTVSRDDFARALGVASKAVSTRSQVLPILSHVLLVAEADRLTIAGTDLDARAWQSVGCTVTEAGSVTLPPKPLADFLDACPPDGSITLAVNAQHKAELACGVIRVRLAGLDPEGFPPETDFSAPACDLTLAADTLATLIASVAHAIAPDQSRPVLCGILLRSDGATLQAVAADGYRLALRSAEVEGPDVSVIVPGKALVKAAGLLGDATSVRLAVDANGSTLLFDTEAGCWSMRLLEGQFPDFSRIIPPEAPLLVTADRTDLVRALRLVRQVEKIDTGYRVLLLIGEDEITFSAGTQTADLAATTTIPCTRLRGADPLTIAFNTAYLRDAVEAIGGSAVTLELTSAATAGIVRAPGARNGHLQIVMPVSVSR